MRKIVELPVLQPLRLSTALLSSLVTCVMRLGPRPRAQACWDYAEVQKPSALMLVQRRQVQTC